MRTYCLYFAWLIACISTLGSLFFSEVLHLEPCHLCWYQRICIFPLAFILGMAYYRNNLKIAPYALPLIITGFFLAVYQVFLQETGLTPIEMCGAGPSCSDKVNIGLGFISLPMLSACALLFMGILLWMANRVSTCPMARSGVGS